MKKISWLIILCFGNTTFGNSYPADDPKGYYTVLEVSTTASQETIKKAYYKRARETHPDKLKEKHKALYLPSKDNDLKTIQERKKLEEPFKRVNNAYEILKDPSKRKLYDYEAKLGSSRSSQPDDPNLNSRFYGSFSRFSAERSESSPTENSTRTSSSSTNRQQHHSGNKSAPFSQTHNHQHTQYQAPFSAQPNRSADFSEFYYSEDREAQIAALCGLFTYIFNVLKKVDKKRLFIGGVFISITLLYSIARIAKNRATPLNYCVILLGPCKLRVSSKGEATLYREGFAQFSYCFTV